MPVAHVSTATNRTGVGGSTLTVNITVSGTNPVLVVHTSSNSPTPNDQYPTGVSWSLGGSLTKIKEKLNTLDTLNALAQSWALAAPTAGAGTVTVTYDVTGSSRAAQIAAQVFSGANQTTPCPAADAASTDTRTSPSTLTPANLTSDDASAGIASATFGVPSAGSPNQRYLDAVNDPTTIVADATGTTGVSFSGDTDWQGGYAATAVRIVAAAASATVDGPLIAGLHFSRIRRF